MTNKPESWNDESLKALSVRAVRAAPDDVESAHYMRACVLSGLTLHGLAPPSAAELKEAAMHFDDDRSALCKAPAWKAKRSTLADQCRRTRFF